MTVFLHELKANRKSTLTWTLSLVSIVVIFMSIYPAYSSAAEEMKKLFEGFPPEMLKALGFDINLIFSPLGYYSFTFTYIILSGSIQAMILGASLISKEFNRKTADFLFTKPISRIEILSGKILAGIVSLLVTDVLVIGASYATAQFVSVESFDPKLFIMISATLIFVEMMFYALGVLVAVIVQRMKSVLGISLGTVFAFFVAGMLGSAVGEEKIRYFIPFQYYEPLRLIRESSYEPVFIILNILFVVGAISISYLIYIKKDIHSV